MSNISELAQQRLQEYRAFVTQAEALAGEKLGRVQDLLGLLSDDERHAFGRQHGLTFADTQKDVEALPEVNDEGQES